MKGCVVFIAYDTPFFHRLDKYILYVEITYGMDITGVLPSTGIIHFTTTPHHY